MSDYIKREDAKQLFLNHMGNEFPQSIKEQIVEKAFEELPLSADVVEVRHGKWRDMVAVNKATKEERNARQCSICGAAYFVYKEVEEEVPKYCPHCGARMDREEQEHEL